VTAAQYPVAGDWARHLPLSPKLTMTQDVLTRFAQVGAGSVKRRPTSAYPGGFSNEEAKGKPRQFRADVKKVLTRAPYRCAVSVLAEPGCSELG
jgi:hypothetical protein